MLQGGVDGHRGLRPVLRQRDALAHRCRQPLGQRQGIGWPHRLPAHRDDRRQLRQPVAVARRAMVGKAQYMLARQHGVEVGLAGGSGQAAPGADRRIRHRVFAGGHQRAEALRAGPAQQRCDGWRGGRTRCRRGRFVEASHGRPLGRTAALHGPPGGLRGPLGQQAQQVQRPAGLRAGARQAFAAEGLHPHHGADDVAVDVDVARTRCGQHLRHGFVDTRVNALRKPVAGGVDCLQRLREALAPVAQHVQHRAEDLTLELGHLRQLDDRGRDVMAAQRRAHAYASAHARGQIGPPYGAAPRLHRRHVALQAGACLGVDDRAHVGGERARVADAQLAHCSLEHAQHAVGHVFLHAEQTQRRAALAGAVEGRAEDVGHGLFGQRRAVDEQRVLPAGLGDQRHRPPGIGKACGERPLQQPRHFVGAGEQHALHAGVCHQRSAHRLAAAGQQLQRGARHAGGMQSLHGGHRHQWRLLSGFGQHHVAGRQRRGDLAGEDG